MRDSPKSPLTLPSVPNANPSLVLDDSCANGLISSKQNKTSSLGNHTLRSQPGKTFIIKPLNGEACPNFAKNPVKLARSMKVYPFSSLDIKNVKTNQRRNLIAIEVYNITDNLKAAILETKTFAEVEVTAYIPKSETQVMGVIGPIDSSVSMEDLKELLTCEGSAIIENVMRLNKFVSGKKTTSTSVRITFSGSNLPSSVYVDFMKYGVREYKQGPLRCYNCQMFGHAAGGCTRPRACVHCSSNHDAGECPNESAKCANCKGNHKASSSDCPTYKKFATLTNNRKTNVKNIPTSTHSSLFQPMQQSVTEQRPQNAFQLDVDIHQSQGSYFNAPLTNSVKSYASATKESTNNNSDQINLSNNKEIFSALSTMQETIISAITDIIERKQSEQHEMILKKIDEQITANNNKIAKLLQEAFTSLNLNKKTSAQMIFD